MTEQRTPQASPTEGGSDDIRRSALRSVGWISIERWASRLMGLVVFAVLGRVLDPAAFGLVALATVFVSIVTVFVDAGFSQVLVQRASLSQVQISTAFWASIGLSVAMYAVLALAAYPLAALYGQPKLAPILLVLGLQLPITAVSSIPSSLLVRDLSFGTLAVRSLVGVVVGSTCGVAAALTGLGAWSLIVQTLTAAVVSGLILLLRSPWRPSFEFDLAELRQMWGFGVFVLGTEAVNLVNGQADKLLVGSFLGPAALGYYYVGSRLVTIMSELLTTVISRVSLSLFSRLQDDLARMMRAYYTATFVSAAVALPAFGTLAVLAPLVVPLVFGDQWGPTVLILQLLVPASAVASVIYFDKSALLAQGFARDTFLLALANTVFGVVLMVVAAPLGAVAVAISLSVRQIAFWPVRQTVMHRRLGLAVGRYLRRFVKPLAATLVSMGVMWAVADVVPGVDLIKVVVAAATGGLVYLASILLIARQEIESVTGPLPGPRRHARAAG